MQNQNTLTVKTSLFCALKAIIIITALPLYASVHSIYEDLSLQQEHGLIRKFYTLYPQPEFDF